MLIRTTFPGGPDAGSVATSAFAVRDELDVKAVSLAQALEHNEQIRNNLERWADELLAINEVLLQVTVPRAKAREFERTLDRCEALESAILESADALSAVNAGLTKSVAADATLSRKWQLSDTRARKMRERATRDPLTGLPNRALFDDRLRQALAHARRNGERVAVAFIDLDHFKNVNDSSGHEAGDGVLRAVATRLQSSVREGDMVSRFGGDEFICLLVESGEQVDFENVVERVVRQISHPIKVGGAQHVVYASIGVAIYPESAGTAESLITNADTAMYRAKRARSGVALAPRI
ncbi:MAG: GGDEF domain-containing protein [Casimicrobiaceae bacterium]